MEREPSVEGSDIWLFGVADVGTTRFPQSGGTQVGVEHGLRQLLPRSERWRRARINGDMMKNEAG